MGARGGVWPLVLAALLLAGCGAPAAPVAPAEEAPRELRGVWLTNVDSDVLFSPQTLTAALDTLQQQGFNVVFPVVWNKGYTLHPSDVMADLFGEAYRQDSLFRQQGRDPLAEVVAEGHRRGMAVIPWFEFGFASSYQADGGHLLAAYPHWAARDSAGGLLTKNGFEWMNGLHPEVQTFMLRLVQEVITRYDVDGIQGDDRLPAMPSEGGYSAYTVDLYRQEHGGQDPPPTPRDAAFVQWKADKLTAFGRRLYDQVKAHDSTLVVSLSPSVYPWSLDEYLQDWPAWIEAGQVDWLHPQAYRYDIDRYKTTIDEVVHHFEASDGHEQVVLAPGVLVKAGPRYNGPAYVTEALRYHRGLGLEGEVFFFYEGLDEKNEWLGDTLAVRFYREPAVIPR